LGGGGGRRHFDWPITNKFGDIGHSPVKAKGCLTLAPHSLKIKAQRFFPLAFPYSLYTPKLNFGQSVWLKVCPYWECLGEHFANLVRTKENK